MSKVTNINKNEKVVIASKDPLLLFDYCNASEAMQSLKNAENEKQKLLFKFNNRNLKTSNNAQQKIYQEYLLKADYEILTMDEYIMLQQSKILNSPVRKILESEFYEVLNIFAPASIKIINDCTICTVSELIAGNYTKQYAEKDGEYYTKIADIFNRSTWIHNYI